MCGKTPEAQSKVLLHRNVRRLDNSKGWVARIAAYYNRLTSAVCRAIKRQAGW
jgi:hypothetical protein